MNKLRDMLTKGRDAFRRKSVTAYEKLEEARVEMKKARAMKELCESDHWHLVRQWLSREAVGFQRRLNSLSAAPQWNAEEIVHLNAQRQAREDLIAEIENAAKQYETLFHQVNELEDFIAAAEALKRANAG